MSFVITAPKRTPNPVVPGESLRISRKARSLDGDSTLSITYTAPDGLTLDGKKKAVRAHPITEDNATVSDSFIVDGDPGFYTIRISALEPSSGQVDKSSVVANLGA